MMEKMMLKLLVIMLVYLGACVDGSVVSDVESADNPVSQNLNTGNEFYEAYQMTGHSNNRHLAVKIELGGQVPKAIHIVELSADQPRQKISDLHSFTAEDYTLRCTIPHHPSKSSQCEGRNDRWELMLSWVTDSKTVAQLVVYITDDTGEKNAYGYNKVLTAMGKNLDIDSEQIRQQYFVGNESAEDASNYSFAVNGKFSSTDLTHDKKPSTQLEVEKVFQVSFIQKKPNEQGQITTPPLARLEVQDDAGNVIEDVLASAGQLERLGQRGIFLPTNTSHFYGYNKTTHYYLFLTPEAIERQVSKIVAYAEGIYVGEVALGLLPSPRTMTAEDEGNGVTLYQLSPKPDGSRRGDFRWQHLIFKKLDGDGVVSDSDFDSKRDQGNYRLGGSTYSDMRPDSTNAWIDNFPCVAPDTVYAWLASGEMPSMKDRQLYRLDCP